LRAGGAARGLLCVGAMNVAVERAGRSWSVRVEGAQGSGEPVEYRFRSERQARFFAAVVALGPPSLPKAHRARKRKAKTIAASIEEALQEVA
jgi:hypothetical protein